MNKLFDCPRFLIRVSCTAALLVGLGTAFAQTDPVDGGTDAAPNGPVGPERIEGAWQSSVTLHDCRTGTVVRTFKGLTVLHRGGTASATNNLPPTGGGPAFGTWRRALAPATYEINLRFFRFNPDGSWAGAQNLRRRVTQLDGNTLTGTLAAQVLDSEGNILQTVCGSEAASRLAPF